MQTIKLKPDQIIAYPRAVLDEAQVSYFFDKKIVPAFLVTKAGRANTRPGLRTFSNHTQELRDFWAKRYPHIFSQINERICAESQLEEALRNQDMHDNAFRNNMERFGLFKENYNRFKQLIQKAPYYLIGGYNAAIAAVVKGDGLLAFDVETSQDFKEIKRNSKQQKRYGISSEISENEERLIYILDAFEEELIQERVDVKTLDQEVRCLAERNNLPVKMIQCYNLLYT